jgi:hypothetical protein
MRVTVDGDAEKGWIVDCHDGVNSSVQHPAAADAAEAAQMAVEAHEAQFAAQPAAEPGAPFDPAPLLAKIAELTERLETAESDLQSAIHAICARIEKLENPPIQTQAQPGSEQAQQQDPANQS